MGKPSDLSAKCAPSTEMCRFIGKELRENAPAVRESKEAGFTQFLTHKYTLLSMLLWLKDGMVVYLGNPSSCPVDIFLPLPSRER